jgi:hypothetical protein
MQYTLRNVPAHLDATLRSTAQRQGKSLNDVTLEALARGAGISDLLVRRRNLDDIANSWNADPVFDQAIADQDVIDETIWA